MENKPEVIKKRLRKKGFVLDTTRFKGHDGYVIYDPETGKTVATCFSRGKHGKDTLGQGLLHKIGNELGFDNYEDFQDFISCTMSEEKYRGRLKAKGLLNRKPRAWRGLFRR